MSAAAPPRVAVVGALGHGASHVARALAATAAGTQRLVALADPRVDAVTGVPDAVRRHASLAALLEAEVPDVVVLSTPIDTHAALAAEAMRAGADVLLEKPPAATTEQHAGMVALAAATGRLVQVGFQSLGSAAVPYVRERVAAGRLGEVTGYAAWGLWVRPRSYWRRARWAGHRSLDGRPVADGVLTNPLAHAVATVLALAGHDRSEDVTAVTTDLHRVEPGIACDDTSAARVALRDGTDVLVAVTLAAQERGEPAVVVEGTRGRITLWYTLDVVVEERAGRPPLVTRHDRVDLLEDLLAARASGGPLRVPLERTGAFMRVLDAVLAAPDPALVPARFLERTGTGDGERVRLVGVEGAVARAVAERRTFAELGLPWAGGAADGPRGRGAPG
ncbi:Gfo/Idh/MocA family protein [Cellulomonas endophytica]|uniref:Gfo/Idh/MocA family protein n=1 Tax=Cellulomonas endophytica TaxID=2494735 RepID=UPI0013E9750E|nr:Gfo/Idh/MocA family oxidoreductase [Cellulomonas endophytica]